MVGGTTQSMNMIVDDELKGRSRNLFVIGLSLEIIVYRVALHGKNDDIAYLYELSDKQFDPHAVALSFRIIKYF